MRKKDKALQKWANFQSLLEVERENSFLFVEFRFPVLTPDRHLEFKNIEKGGMRRKKERENEEKQNKEVF